MSIDNRYVCGEIRKYVSILEKKRVLLCGAMPNFSHHCVILFFLISVNSVDILKILGRSEQLRWPQW